MREVAIKKILSELENRNIDLKNMIALDFFARQGDWQTMHYADKVLETHAWEINESYKKNLIKNLPNNSKVLIGDSFDLAKKESKKFDMIIIDNPQGCFGENYEHCEHFEAIDAGIRLLKYEGGILIFNVKTKPFNYDSNIRWQRRRNTFYLVEDASDLSEDFMFNFYKNYLSLGNFHTDFIFWEKRPQESGLYEMAVKIRRKDL